MMARKLRIHYEGAIYHVTLRGVDRRRIFMDGFTYHQWAGVRVAMEKQFIFVPVASYRGGALRLFELRPRVVHGPTT